MLAKSSKSEGKKIIWRVLLVSVVSIIAVICLITFNAPKKEPHKPKLVTVTTAAARLADVPVEIRSIGTVMPINSVAIKARAGGNLIGVHFKEGQFVHKGDLLYTIDQRPLLAALNQAESEVAKQKALVEQAKAAVEKDQASLLQSKATFVRDQAQNRQASKEADRYLDLSREGAVSTEQAEQLRTTFLSTSALVKSGEAAIKNAQAVINADKANVRSTQAQYASAQAGLDNARVQLSYTTITAPISGRTGNLQVLLGNNVRPAEDVLVTINQISPIYVQFSVPQQQFPSVQQYGHSGALKVTATHPNGQSLAQGGRVTFMDNTVDSTSGTVKLKAEFNNTASQLWPGQYVNIVLRLTTLNNATVVPSQSVQNGQIGQFVWVLKADKTVHMQPVVTGPAVGDSVTITSGVNSGDLVVTDGQLQLTENSKVKVSEKEL